MEKYDFSGYATRNDLRCADGLIIRKDAFRDCDGETVTLIYNHDHSNPENVLGHALLENRDDGVYAYCTFNDSDSGKAMKKAVQHGDVRALSIYANRLMKSGSEVLHGIIREVSLVMAGANPGAYIDYVMAHGEDTDEGIIVNYDENIMVHYYDDSNEETLEHASDDKKNEEAKKEDKTEVADEKKNDNEKTVKDVFDEFTEEQKTVVYALIGQALEDAGVSDDDDKNEDAKHSDEGDDYMYHNVFDNDEQQVNFLSHADQEEIVKMAKSGGSFKAALAAFAEDHQNTLTHGIDNIETLFPDFKDVYPGAPELLERDQSWVASVMKKAHKSPVSRIRTRHADARAAEVRAKGYNNRDTKKAISANVAAVMRTTEPQTVFYRDNLHRDDVLELDFDVIAYQKNIMKRGLEEEVALAALVGDGRADDHGDKIKPTNIRPIWTDDDVYTIKAAVDIDAMSAKLQGTSTGANFGEEFIFAEAVISAALYAREQYKGKGLPDFYCAPHTLNVMLMARDLNGRRIYDSAADLAKVLNVGEICTVEQMNGLKRTDDADQEFELLGLFVNMTNYVFGCAKGGEITNFEDFDIDFNTYKYMMETRLSGALAHPLSAIALEKPVTAVAAG